ncbi:MAG: PLDc N-terminal domain-containing protein [Nanoarchaeota archaeon]|nr:PLDc N-terminal domain-containing protein [Nanoarchaeota archaeon]
MFDSIFWFPFMAAGFGLMMILGILVVLFWLWMIVDCAKRSFQNDVEKIIWLVVIVFGSWIGALVYFIVVRSINHKGLFKK